MTHSNRFGASSYLTMGAVLVPNKIEGKIRSSLEETCEVLGVTQLHCTDMSHPQVSYFTREIKKLRILCFGVISKKSTLGAYKEMIEGDDQAHDYYNKCAQYLLELVAQFIADKGVTSEDVHILFEKKRGHDYSRLGRYLKAIAAKPIDSRAAKLAHLAPYQIDAKTKDEESILALADAVAYTLHKAFCSENNKLGLTEQRYLRELKGKFHSCDQTGKIANHGIKFIKGPVEMGLKADEFAFAMKFYSKAEQKKR